MTGKVNLSVEANGPHHICIYCTREDSKLYLKTCSNCESVQYCGSKFQQCHWKSHKKTCKAIFF